MFREALITKAKGDDIFKHSVFIKTFPLLAHFSCILADLILICYLYLLYSIIMTCKSLHDLTYVIHTKTHTINSPNKFISLMIKHSNTSSFHRYYLVSTNNYITALKHLDLNIQFSTQ